MNITRRHFAIGSVAAATSWTMPSFEAPAAGVGATRPIPSSGERLPLVGLGSWITFNVGDDRQLQDECAAVIAAFLAGGGRLIDSSPMYGSSQPTIGYGLRKKASPEGIFSADKVWTADTDGGAAQIERSREAWGVPQFDLLQVHNLLAWEAHLPLLFKMKADGKLRYVEHTRRARPGRRRATGARDTRGRIARRGPRARPDRPAAAARRPAPAGQIGGRIGAGAGGESRRAPASGPFRGRFCSGWVSLTGRRRKRRYHSGRVGLTRCRS